MKYLSSDTPVQLRVTFVTSFVYGFHPIGHPPFVLDLQQTFVPLRDDGAHVNPEGQEEGKERREHVYVSPE